MSFRLSVIAPPALPPTERGPTGRDLSDRPITAAINIGAAVLLEILCPLCWEALILLCVAARFASR